MDSIKSFPSLFELLWYSRNPCFDVVRLTSDRIHEKSIIKKCLWKGEQIDCSLVFTMTPTDAGMCCRFDLRKAKNVFKTNMFFKSLENLQVQDMENAFETKNASIDILGIDLKPEVGRFLGLTLILDAHSDLVSDNSVEEDSNRFLVGLTKSGEFQLMGQGTKVLKPGHEHFLSLTAVDTISDRKIETSLTPEKRKCFFPQEKSLKLHTKYSQSACLFECGITQVKLEANFDCLPWFFPSVGGMQAEICDPWDTQTFMKALRRVPRSKCQDCLPDCQTTSFSLSSSSAPFRPCTSLNKGLSGLCSYSSPVSPSLASSDIMEEYSHLANLPQYVQKYSQEDSSRRKLSSGVEYDAYKDDIAIVHIYWDTASVLQFERTLRLTWIDYISQVIFPGTIILKYFYRLEVCLDSV